MYAEDEKIVELEAIEYSSPRMIIAHGQPGMNGVDYEFVLLNDLVIK